MNLMKQLTTSDLLDLKHSTAGDMLSEYVYPWEAVPHIKEIILALSETLGDDYNEISDGVFVHKTAKTAPTAYIGAPAIICEGAEIRHCAFIRGSAIVGRGSVVGNSVELKNAILFDNVQVPHFNYVGDSILGYKSHMGAGSVTSNVKSDKTNVEIPYCGEKIKTGMRKLGAILGDNVEIGCNSTLNPGTVIGRGSRVYPNSSVRGFIPAEHIYKSRENIVLIMKGGSD